MAEQNVITFILDDLAQQQPIHTAICIGEKIDWALDQSIEWQYFSPTEALNLPFCQRYDLGLVFLQGMTTHTDGSATTQMLVKLRDLMAKRLVVVASLQDEQLLRALGFSQRIDLVSDTADIAIWQFNILNYKQVPDWLNAKFWANPERWNKYRW